MIKKELFFHKIEVEKHNHFDNLMKYSITDDEKYIRKIGEFYKSIENLDIHLQCGIFDNIFEEFNSSISKNKEKTVNNILNLYGKTYLQIEELEKRSNIKKNENERDILRTPKILVIDDDKFLLNIIEKSMEKQGYNIISCGDSLEGIEILREEEIELIVLDMILPKIDGYQMIKIIREIDPLIPLIIISQKRDIETKMEVLKLGADDYITKPINIKELDARIHRALERNEIYKAINIEDGLTGVHNKEYFWSRANEERDLYCRNKKIFSIALIDLDSFKKVNDSFGHLVGDQILKCFSKCLKDLLRDTDLIFRFGGDEFIVIFPETEENQALELMNSFKENAVCSDCNRKCFTLNNLKFSVGITEIQNTDDTIEEIFKRADSALNEAKKLGGDKSLIYKD